MSKYRNFWCQPYLCTVFLCCLCSCNTPVNTQKCPKNQYGVKTKDGQLVCKLCANLQPCPAGIGLSVACGDIVPFGEDIHCVHCVAGKTYSGENNNLPCQKCKSQSCHENEEVTGICTIEKDSTSCSGKCKKGFYRTGIGLENCLPCSACLNISNISSTRVEKCKNDGLPREKQCEFGSLVGPSKIPSQPSKKKNYVDECKSYRYKIYGHPAIFGVLLAIIFILLICLALTCRRKFRKKRGHSVCAQEEEPLNQVNSTEQRSDSGVAETDIDVYDGDTDLPVSSAGKRKASAGSSGRKVSFSRQDSVNSHSNTGSEFDDERSVHSAAAVDNDELLTKETDSFDEKPAVRVPGERRRTLSSSSGRRHPVFRRQISNPEVDHKEREKPFHKRRMTISSFTSLISGQKLATKEEAKYLLLTDAEDSDNPPEAVELPEKSSFPEDEGLTMKTKDINGNIPSQVVALPPKTSARSAPGPSRLSDVKIEDLNAEIFRQVCVKLNADIPGKDWNTLAGRMEYSTSRAKEFGQHKNPAEKLLEHWGAKGGNDVARLIKLLQDMERTDVIELLKSHLNPMDVLI